MSELDLSGMTFDETGDKYPIIEEVGLSPAEPET